MEDVKKWHRSVSVERTVEALEKNGFNVLRASTKEEASNKILEMIPTDASVGFGGSVTLRELGLPEALKKRGNDVADHDTRHLDRRQHARMHGQHVVNVARIQPKQVPTATERIGQPHHSFLPAFDEVGQIVSEDVPHHYRDERMGK